ncbi:MAG: Mu transposase C-terminal domain-containing protein [Ruminococcus sp.]|jgi:putative transposase
MQKNELWKSENRMVRVLEQKGERVFVIDCVKRSMPKWVCLAFLDSYTLCSEEELLKETGITIPDIDSLDMESRRFIREHYTLIAPVLPYVSKEKQRNYVINRLAAEKGVSKQTIRKYLCLYLVYQNEAAFCPKQKKKRELNEAEKNMRWGLNKFYYTQHRNSLTTAYMLMIREKYCDEKGRLLSNRPSIHQFRYFEKKHRNLQTYYITRNGIKDYQRNHRPLLGDGVQEFASHVGVGMLDATICDIYLVNESGGVVGRPILTACMDAYSGLCCGYALSWEGGTYSLRGLLLNVIADKQEHCRQFGIAIQEEDWPCDKLPGTLVTDMGSEYVSETFSQITELGVTLIHLPAYRPELKGPVEKFFDLIQGYYKPYLKGKGVVEPDFKQRGKHDYRRDACLTMHQFETILLHCIRYYNSKRVVEGYTYTPEMIQEKVGPFSSSIWKYGVSQPGTDLLSISREELILTLLPRVQGKFTRQGLKVNGMRYKNGNYMEKYLSGGVVETAYNPDNVSVVWVVDDGSYIPFDLIESRYKGKTLLEAETLKSGHKAVIKANRSIQEQAKVNLSRDIETICLTAYARQEGNIKGIRENRQREQKKVHKDYLGGVFHE